jgi:branched-chain amino acid transport system ATP-binding protein
MTSTPALRIAALTKHFGAARIINGVTLDVLPGEKHALIGPNGAGKSTLFALVSGLLKPTAGSIELNGRRIDGMTPHAINRLGMARSFQITSIFPRMSVFENLRLSVMARHGMRYGLFQRVGGQATLRRETEDILEQVRLTASRDRMAGDLAYAEQRALEIGMSLGPGADLILLDEPTAGMAGEESHYMVELIRTVTQGKTLLVIEHDMDVVFSLADRISVLVYGTVIATGTPEEIRENAQVQEAYLGEVVAGANE